MRILSEQIMTRGLPVIALMFVLSGVAEAGTLRTSTLRAAGSDVGRCECVNISTSTRQMTVEVIDADSGNVIVTSGPFQIPPNRRIATSFSSATAWCRFPVQGGKRKFRAQISVQDSISAGTRAALPGN